MADDKAKLSMSVPFNKLIGTEHMYHRGSGVQHRLRVLVVQRDERRYNAVEHIWSSLSRSRGGFALEAVENPGESREQRELV